MSSPDSTQPPSEAGPKSVEIHVSDMRTFKQCRRKWSFASPLGRGLEPKVPYPPFFTGRAIHYALSKHYETGELAEDTVRPWVETEVKAIEAATGDLWATEQDRFEEQTTLIERMMEHYGIWQRHAVGLNDDWNLKWIATEMEFNIPLGRSMPKVNEDTGEQETHWWLGNTYVGKQGVLYAGRFDGVVQRVSDGTYWLFESKTTRSIKELKRSLANDEQATLYAWAAQQIIGKPISGILYNLMRKKEPSVPHMLQMTGKLSVAKNIDTTLEVYWEAAKRAHPNATHDQLREWYADILAILEEKGNTFFSRYEVRRTQRELQETIEYLIQTAREMLNPDTPLYPNPSWMNCNFCHFRGPCLMMNAGGDVEFVLNEEYQKRVAYDETVKKLEGEGDAS